MADGNFKADHVRQKNEVDDVWLSEGSGMIPKREEYFTFLATAIERLTVSTFIFYMHSAPVSAGSSSGSRLYRYLFRFHMFARRSCCRAMRNSGITDRSARAATCEHDPASGAGLVVRT